MILVLGGGFGLYGHVAALAAMGSPVATLARYRPDAVGRPELAPLLDRIEWIENEEEAIAQCRLLTLARRPADNCLLARRLAEAGREPLVIEKPIAPDPRAADELTELLAMRGWKFAVPYLFLHSDWFDVLAAAIARGTAARIDWIHRTAPTMGAWKLDESAGGGPIGFYLIHCLALFESLIPGATPHLTKSTGGRVALNAGERLSINFGLGGRPRFRVSAAGAALFEAAGPFGRLPGRGALDPRLPALARFYRAIGPAAETAPPPTFHIAVHGLWRHLVQRTAAADWERTSCGS